jgi:hypothetical protein
MRGLGDLELAMPDQTEKSPKSCSAFSAAERGDANPAQDALTQIPAVRRSTIITFAIWTCDRADHRLSVALKKGPLNRILSYWISFHLT